MIKYFFILLISAQILSACKNSIESTATSVPAQSLLNVSYGNDAQQKMDIYLPADRSATNTKFVLMIHGGGWSSGDKTDFNEYVDSIKKRLPGYAIFNMNYRLATGSVNVFPAQENDVKMAVEFIATRLNEYHISQKMVLMGASAGAHLALLQGYKYDSPIKPKAIVDFFGPTDMAELYNNSTSSSTSLLVSLIVGATPVTNADLYYQSSPINFVTAQSPATIILQGGVDPLVSPSQSAKLNEKLQTFGVTHQYVLYPGEGHGWYGAKLADSFDKIQSFLANTVN
jgi:acetyl esterase/lipase